MVFSGVRRFRICLPHASSRTPHTEKEEGAGPGAGSGWGVGEPLTGNQREELKRRRTKQNPPLGGLMRLC